MAEAESDAKNQVVVESDELHPAPLNHQDQSIHQHDLAESAANPVQTV